jgi:hypothetical protein
VDQDCDGADHVWLQHRTVFSHREGRSRRKQGFDWATGIRAADDQHRLGGAATGHVAESVGYPGPGSKIPSERGLSRDSPLAGINAGGINRGPWTAGPLLDDAPAMIRETSI